MITDHVRFKAYQLALKKATSPGKVVVDIGAGTGIFSLLASQYGAAEVHAVEPDRALLLAQTIASANGLQDQIRFYQTLSTELKLHKLADVIISDLRGVLPLFQHHIASISDARRRLLAPDGVLIPARDQLWASLIEDPNTFARYSDPWLNNECKLDLSAAYPLVINTRSRIGAKAEQLLVRPAHWATLDYATIDNPDVTGTLKWTVERPGTAHGLVVWFDAELAEGIGFSNRPGEPELIYGQAFFPLESPVELKPGDDVSVTLSAKLVEDDYLWRWATRVRTGEHLKANFRQSTFYAAPVNLEKVKRRADNYVPAAGPTAQVDHFVLSQIDGTKTLGEIALSLMTAFPERFTKHTDALTYSADLAERYRPSSV